MRGMQQGVFEAGKVCVDFCSRREDTSFPGFSLPTEVSLSLSWLFGSLGLSAVPVPA